MLVKEKNVLPSLFLLVTRVIFFTSALLVMTIGMHLMSNRTSIIIGAVFKTTATVLAALSTDVGVLFFSIGVLDGNKHTRRH